MFKKLNKVVFGIIHRFSSATFRLFGFDNYAWCATSFVVAGVTSLFLYNEAMKLAAAEKDPEIAQMRQSSALFGVIVMVFLAGVVLYFRKDIRKVATKHYDLGNQVSLGFSLFGWGFVAVYALSLSFSYWPGNLDMLIFGIGVMFLLSEPPPMEERMNRAFRK